MDEVKNVFKATFAFLGVMTVVIYVADYFLGNPGEEGGNDA